MINHKNSFFISISLPELFSGFLFDFKQKTFKIKAYKLHYFLQNKKEIAIGVREIAWQMVWEILVLSSISYLYY